MRFLTIDFEIELLESPLDNSCSLPPPPQPLQNRIHVYPSQTSPMLGHPLLLLSELLVPALLFGLPIWFIIHRIAQLPCYRLLASFWLSLPRKTSLPAPTPS